MNKTIDFDELDQKLETIKSKGKLVIAGGCFDVLHEGHIRFLEKAKKHGDILLIILESDESVRRRKGADRPVNNQRKRARFLSRFDSVDYVLTIPDFKRDENYYNLVKKLQPDIIAVTKKDPIISKKSEQAKLVGGEIIEVIDRIPNLSTSNILNKQTL